MSDSSSLLCDGVILHPFTPRRKQKAPAQMNYPFSSDSRGVFAPAAPAASPDPSRQPAQILG
jgi:hypothetical protein